MDISFDFKGKNQSINIFSVDSKILSNSNKKNEFLKKIGSFAVEQGKVCTPSALEAVKGIPADFESLDLETLEFEYLMMALRTLEGVNDAEYARRFASLEPWKGNLRKRLLENPLWKEFEGKKMCLSRESECGGRNFALNREGLLFLNSLLRNF